MRRRAAPSTTRTPLQIHRLVRLQNSPYFCVFKYARAVKQKVWNEAENREQDWGETQKYDFFSSRLRLARFARARLLRYALPISLLILRKKKKNRLFCSVQVSEEEWKGECTRSSVLLSLRLYLSYSLGHSLYSYLAIYRFIFRTKNSYRIRLVYDLYQ